MASAEPIFKPTSMNSCFDGTVGAKFFREHRQPIAANARAVVAREAHDHERVVAEAERWQTHWNKMRT